MFLSIVKFTSVKMQPRDVQMPDRFLRQLSFGLAFAKDPIEPPESFAKITAKARRQSKVMRYDTNISFVALSLGGVESDAKLFLGLNPFALDDQTQPTGVGAFDICFRVSNRELACLIEKLIRITEISLSPGDARQSM